MMVNKPVVATAGVTLLLCAGHFISAVYVTDNNEQKSLQIASLAHNAHPLPYQAAAIEQTLSGWLQPLQATAPSIDPMAAQLAGFDNVTLGNVTVALLAIYQQQQPVAVLGLQASGESLEFVRLQAGESRYNIELATISRSHITLRHKEQQKQLQLFNPGSAVTE
jgi:hypothetical protein